MSDKLGISDLKDVLMAMRTLLELEKKVRNIESNQDECSCEEPEDYKEDVKLAKKLNAEYLEMLTWAFGKEHVEDDKVFKSKTCKIWNKLHPSLPDLVMLKYVTNEVSNIALVMQIAPYWHEHKKLNK